MPESYNEAIIDAYQLIVDTLDRKLKSKNYLIVESKLYDHLFGNLYRIWSSDTELIRFAWDSTDRMFTLEYYDEIKLTPDTSWIDMILTDYNPNVHDKMYLQIITKSIADELD